MVGLIQFQVVKSSIDHPIINYLNLHRRAIHDQGCQPNMTTHAVVTALYKYFYIRPHRHKDANILMRFA